MNTVNRTSCHFYYVSGAAEKPGQPCPLSRKVAAATPTASTKKTARPCPLSCKTPVTIERAKKLQTSGASSEDAELTDRDSETSSSSKSAGSEEDNVGKSGGKLKSAVNISSASSGEEDNSDSLKNKTNGGNKTKTSVAETRGKESTDALPRTTRSRARTDTSAVKYTENASSESGENSTDEYSPSAPSSDDEANQGSTLIAKKQTSSFSSRHSKSGKTSEIKKYSSALLSTNSDNCPKLNISSSLLVETSCKMYNSESSTSSTLIQARKNVDKFVKMSSELHVIRQKNPILQLKKKPQFECNICNKTFVSKNSLRVHLLTIHDDETSNKNVRKIYGCAHCPKTFKLREEIVRHLTVHAKPYHCTICNGYFKTIYAYDHHDHKTSRNKILMDDEKYLLLKYACTLCPKRYRTSGTLRIHIKVKHEERPFKCKFCPQTFAIAQNLRKHAEIHGERKKIECHLCNKTFLDKEYIRRHLKYIHKLKTLPDYLIQKESYPVKCDYCDRKFKFSCQLKNHIGIHMNEHPFQCNICHKSFKIKNYLSLHLKTHNNPKKSQQIIHTINDEKYWSYKFPCTYCTMRFKFSSRLKCHLRIHTKDCPFKCDVCSKTYSYAAHLRNHIKTHEGHQSHACHLCSSTFTQKTNLKRHLKDVHKLKPPIILPSELAESERNKVKKLYKCPHCPKTFKWRYQVNYHLPAHKSERPFKCEICDKTLKWHSGYYAHLVTHRTPSFSCGHCDNKFKAKYLLSKHIKKNHTEPARNIS